MTIKSATTWLDILPALPLAKAVPLVTAYGTAVGSDVFEDGTGFYRDGGPWRIDLSDPQGYAYALRWLCSKRPWLAPHAKHLPITRTQRKTPAQVAERAVMIEQKTEFCDGLNRWAAGQTTDADRLALALAIAEVVS
jgi:hypothetical protein